MKVLVTGGGGFLGGAVARRLLAKGHEVRSFSRGDYLSLKELGIEQYRGDLKDASAVRRACEGCGMVFHVAAKAWIWGDFESFYKANVVGTRNVIQSCREVGIDRLIYTSSPSAVFDGKDMEGVDESVPYPDHFKANYPKTKAAAEKLVLAANDETLATVALRPHLIWGPNDTQLVAGVLEKARAGRLALIGSGQNLIDTTYIDDAAEAHVLAGERLKPGSTISGKVYFLSQGEPIPLSQFMNRILKAAGLAPVRKKYSPGVAFVAGAIFEFLYQALRLKGDPPITRFLAEELSTAHWFDISAAKRDLGYQPSVSIDEGFQRLEKWLQAE